MNTFRIAAIAGASLGLMVISGCVGTTHTVPDRTPSWMRYYQTGSRIARPVAKDGELAAPEFVVTTEPEDLQDLPSLTIHTIQR